MQIRLVAILCAAALSLFAAENATARSLSRVCVQEGIVHSRPGIPMPASVLPWRLSTGQRAGTTILLPDGEVFGGSQFWCSARAELPTYDDWCMIITGRGRFVGSVEGGTIVFRYNVNAPVRTSSARVESIVEPVYVPRLRTDQPVRRSAMYRQRARLYVQPQPSFLYEVREISSVSEQRPYTCVVRTAHAWQRSC